MIYSDEKRRFFQALINHHVKPDEFYHTARRLAVAVPEGVLSKWKKKFYSGSAVKVLPDNPRLMNRFTMGADPEYVITDPSNGYMYGSGFGMTTLEACGCDLSGRQMELRVAPSRFVLNIVASMLEILRWQIVKYPLTLSYKWSALGLYGADGCGGHVHFARKTRDRKEEIQSLDGMSGYFAAHNFLPGALDRASGSRYGKAGDVRNTSYGYEYRTLSTWLNSPFTAYLTMVAAKLAIFHDWSAIRKMHGIPMALENLLAAYQYEDDDAAIALNALRIRKLNHTFADTYTAQDMRFSWGLLRVGAKVAAPTGDAELCAKPKLFIPPSIEPARKTQEELFQHLVFNTPLLPTSEAQKTWEPFTLKKDEFPVSIISHEAGLSEIAKGLISKGLFIRLAASNHGETVLISVPDRYRWLARKICMSFAKQNIRCLIGGSGDMTTTLGIPRNPGIRGDRYIVSTAYVEKWRTAILQSGLPIVDYQDYKNLSPVAEPVRKQTYGGHLIFESA